MPGTTSLGLRYPLMGETVDATSWQNLANDIDALMTTVQNLRTKAFHTPTASIGNTGSGSLNINTASGALADMQFNAVNWDTATLANLGVNNDRVTVPPGIWYVRFTAGLLQGFTTATFISVYVRDGAGTIWGAQQTGNVTSGLPGPLTVDTLVLTTAAATAIKGSVIWVGTGGPGQWTASNGASLQVYRIRELVDV